MCLLVLTIASAPKSHQRSITKRSTSESAVTRRGGGKREKKGEGRREKEGVELGRTSKASELEQDLGLTLQIAIHVSWRDEDAQQ